MLIIKQRILSGFGAPAAAALLLSAFAGVAKAGDEPAYTRALDFPNNEGGMFDSAFDSENQ